MPNLIYIGNCGWEPAGNVEWRTPPNDLPTGRELWIGRQDQTEAFRAQYPVGRQYLSGYVIDNTPQDNTPFPGVATIDLIIARAPDFVAHLPATGGSIRTATKSATIRNSTIIAGETEVKATRSLSFYAPETRYSYFAKTAPTGPRFNTPSTARVPRILRSVITASANGKERVFAGGNAPAALLAALYMPMVNIVSSDGGEPIPGTPWFRCTDTVSREYAGD